MRNHPRQIPLNEFTSLRKKPRIVVGSSPCGAREHHNPDPGRRPVLEMFRAFHHKGISIPISNDLDVQQERYQVAQLQGTPVPATPVYPRGYYPPDAGSGSPMFLEHLKAPRGLNHGRTSRGAYERALVQDEPLFVNDIEAARCVLLAPHRIPLEEFTGLRKKPEDRDLLFPVWATLGYNPRTPQHNPRQKTCSGDGFL
ncbi:Hypothetical protein PHPALM_14616 [Phytophthora palmivora]|uniref:ATP-binding cassette (ABC) Superfamily n=1 Tax=Phytophthora palmivora TaxID=4796 RepID=A0A2P4XUC6_9STRA|nr:Hypothetical protein PHPALM_14616 [Phytophthora palmivora]